MAELLTDAKLKKLIEKLVLKVDLDTTSPKKFITLLSEKLGGLDLTSRKRFIKDTIRKVIQSLQEEEEDKEESSEEETEVKKGKKKGVGGLATRKEISKALASFLGKGNQMARTEIVKHLWNYIREKELQNPKDKRQILLDSAMQKVFHVESFTMFTMNKYISAHVHPFNPVDLTSPPKESKKRKSPKKGKRAEKKPRKAGVQVPYKLSPELSGVVGKQILPRPQVTQALWAYIRENKLQNPLDKRQINCDDKLQAVMGGNKTVTMFTMNKYITPHMLEKLDKSHYIHQDEEKGNVSDDDE